MNDTEKYRQILEGPIERFDQRNDPEWIERAEEFYGTHHVRDKAGYGQEYALCDAAWYMEVCFAMECLGSNHRGLYA